MNIVIDSLVLQKKVEELFVAAGVPSQRSEILARCLVDADLCGLSSHGVIRIPVYVRRILQGLTECLENIQVVKDLPAMAVLDGKNVIGQVACEQAMNLAISKAKTTGIACVALGHTNHSGTCGHYSQMAAKENMIGFSFVNTTPLVAVYGGTQKAVGNNPLSVCIPAKKHYPICLDMACSVAQGKIEVLNKKNMSIPLGWAVDCDGNDTTDAKAALKGVLLPIAGPKGSGLAIIIDVLCGILTSSGVGNEVRHLNDPVAQNLGAFFIALDISKFEELDTFFNRVDGYIDYLKSTAKEGQTILMPAEHEYSCREQRLKTGIPIPKAVFDELASVLESLGVDSFDKASYKEVNE